jgi:hypothetical protein
VFSEVSGLQRINIHFNTIQRTTKTEGGSREKKICFCARDRRVVCPILPLPPLQEFIFSLPRYFMTGQALGSQH